MEPTSVSARTYTPKHLAEKILTARNAIEGERKQVTVLFADIRGSLELIEGSDPERAQELLDSAIGAMMEAVHRYEGTVNKVLGDGIMALFGAPLAHEDHAVRACYAALAMQEAIRRNAEGVRRTYGVEIQVRVGLNSGDVVVRAIGNDLTMDYDAIGQTTHLAGRMEQLAVPGTIRLSGDTLQLAEGFIQVKALGPIPVKGLNDPVEVFELVGTTATRTRFQAAVARGLTRFVGRQTELEALNHALARAADGRGQIVALIGEPGVGKSRLFYEFTHSHQIQGWLILESGSVSYGKATAYLPIIDMLKDYFRIEDRDNARGIREKVTGKLLTLDEALKPLLVAFLALLDVPADDAAWEALDPSERRRRTLEATKGLLLRESRVQPVVLVFEDLHWIDSETQVFLDSLVDSLPTVRILLLVNYRPEFGHRWGSKSYYAQRRIDPLPTESSEELLATLLGEDAGLAPLKQMLVERTGGNPFFLEESVRTLVETGALIGASGAYQVAASVTLAEVPATVQGVLAARIDRLPAEDKQLLQMASVIGKDVPYSLLQTIAETPEQDLRRSLTNLQAAEFIYETRLFPSSEYTFKHALTHEVIWPSSLSGSPITTLRRASTSKPSGTGNRRGSVRSSVALTSKRLRTSQTDWSSLRACPTQRIVRSRNSRSSLVSAWAWLPSKAPGRPRWGAPMSEPESCASKWESRRSSAQPFGASGDTNARKLAEEFSGLAQRQNDPALMLQAHHSLWTTQFYVGEFVGCREHTEQGIALYDPREHHAQTFRFGGHDPCVCGHAMAAFSLWLLGYPDQTVARLEDALGLAHELHHPPSLALALEQAAYLHHLRREDRLAKERAEISLELATEQGFGEYAATAKLVQGYAAAEAGQMGEGIAEMRKALAARRAQGRKAEEPHVLAYFIEILAKAGQSEEGRKCWPRRLLPPRTEA
jgi:class 3 adenylate cyclase